MARRISFVALAQQREVEMRIRVPRIQPDRGQVITPGFLYPALLIV